MFIDTTALVEFFGKQNGKLEFSVEVQYSMNVSIESQFCVLWIPFTHTEDFKRIRDFCQVNFSGMSLEPCVFCPISHKLRVSKSFVKPNGMISTGIYGSGSTCHWGNKKLMIDLGLRKPKYFVVLLLSLRSNYTPLWPDDIILRRYSAPKIYFRARGFQQ